MLLSELPSEIICNIALHLPTASGVTRLAQACHRIYKIIRAEESWLFRKFVQAKFPSINTTPYWKDAARALTSRSRALDRLGIIGRFIVLPETITRIGIQEDARLYNPTIGYCPPIDSYEIWNGNSWAERKEVLAWGAGEKLLLRSRQSGRKSQDCWVLFNDVDEPNSRDDIIGLHLLKTDSSSKGVDTEDVIFGRRQGDIRHIALSPRSATYHDIKTFRTEGLELLSTDLRQDGMQSLLSANFLNGSTALYHASTDEDDILPFTWLHPEKPTRGRHSKLLSSSRIAIATHQITDPVIISRISSNGISIERTIDMHDLDMDTKLARYHSQVVTAMEPLNNSPFVGNPGDVFLAAWGDRKVRLHDLRSPRSYETIYRDGTDDHPIYSLQSFSQDRFLAGSGGNALVKLFDLRCTTYSYLDAQGPRKTVPNNVPVKGNRCQYPGKDFNIFLSAQPPPHFNRHITSRPIRRAAYPYRGPIYSMSTPSPSSPTVYTGVAGGLVRLDFASTDDLTGPSKEWFDHNLDLRIDLGTNREQPSVPVGDEVAFKVAGYERPHPDDLTTTSKLRKQHNFWHVSPENDHSDAESGWDRRWEALEKLGAWRRQDG
ncbi:hypothetical protein N7462_007015 [Penicillium macrosclerotiorum]|uniref:uncharacterized protein n=1 Tax=Penicillium macrosclerotiorum TaxID=303699 RepID=UPI002548CAEF|nr:uncharacterized protein N7462_007015 [Penicillium macrosclerotiorum]KAJ5678771.1 hypothetical protein N7462_007015 [Penicillium macrosclerotiorum]